MSGVTPAQPGGWGSRLGMILVGGYTVAVFILLLWPNGERVRRLNLDLYLWGLNRGVPAWITPEWYAIWINVWVLAPLVCGLVLLVSRVDWRVWASVGLIGALGVEAVQALLIPGRSPAWDDVAANSVGAVIGALVGRLIGRRLGSPRSHLR